jgi:hypothetical protein
MKSLLEAIARLPPADAERVRARVPAELARDVAAATSIDWLPFETNLAVTRAVHDALGQAAFYRFFRDAMRDAFSGPLLKIVVEAAVRVFRVDAAAFAGWVGKGWGLVFRDCGAWAVERAGAGEATLRISGLPAAALVDDVWPRSVAHSLDAFWAVSRATGECAFVTRDEAAGTATYRLSWK